MGKQGEIVEGEGDVEMVGASGTRREDGIDNKRWVEGSISLSGLLDTVWLQ